MSREIAEQGGTELVETDRMVVAGGVQQASPPTMSLNDGEEEQENASIPAVGPVVGFQNNLLDDEEEQCRICHSPGSEERPLYYPCACNGSIKFTHEDCLLLWLNDRSTKQCEICRHEITLRYEYAQSTPARLPLVEVIRGIAMMTARSMRSLTLLDLILNLMAPITCLFSLFMLLFLIPVDSSSNIDALSRDLLYALSLWGKKLSGLVIILMSEPVFERLWELWLQKVRGRRQLVMEVLHPGPGPVGFGVLNLALRYLNTHVFSQLRKALRVVLPLAIPVWMSPRLDYSRVKNPPVDSAYGWQLGFLGVVALCYLGERMIRWLSDLHDSIRDDKYLIGKRVQNFGDYA